MNPDLQQRLCDCFARVGKAFANGHRLALLHHLGQGERSVEALSRLVGLTLANTSQHLQQLRHAGLVESRKDGQNVIYRLTDPLRVTQLVDLIQGLAVERLHEAHCLVEQLGRERSTLGSAGLQTLLERVAAGRGCLLDLRHPEEYTAGHLPGAINAPFARLDEWIERLRGEEVWVYSRGPWCEEGPLAVRRLRAAGIEAHDLGLGVPQCRLAGIEPEAGAASGDGQAAA